MAVLGEQYVPPVGNGKGQALSPNDNWPAAPPYAGKGIPKLPISKQQREANGPCWFFDTGACIRKGCNKEHRRMSPEELAFIPTEWCNRNLPENKMKGKGRTPSGGKDGWQTDQSATGADDAGQNPKRWTQRTTGVGEGEGKPSGKGTRPCRFIENNKRVRVGLTATAIGLTQDIRPAWTSARWSNRIHHRGHPRQMAEPLLGQESIKPKHHNP
jgi:hypothetical protein